LLRIDESETLSAAVAQTCLRKPVFQPGGNVTDIVVANVKSAYALQVMFDGFYGKGLL
jgi:DUF971 family protein